MAECRVGKRDGCAVRTRALAGVLQEWVDRWDRDHPDLAAGKRKNGRRIGGGGSEQRRNGLGQLTGNGAVGALTILHERTRQVSSTIDEEGREVLGPGVSKDTIRAMLTHRASDYTELRTADLLVAAVEAPEVFHDGTLSVEPNPFAAKTARESCCGGSLNGSGAQT